MHEEVENDNKVYISGTNGLWYEKSRHRAYCRRPCNGRLLHFCSDACTCTPDGRENWINNSAVLINATWPTTTTTGGAHLSPGEIRSRAQVTPARRAVTSVSTLSPRATYRRPPPPPCLGSSVLFLAVVAATALHQCLKAWSAAPDPTQLNWSEAPSVVTPFFFHSLPRSDSTNSINSLSTFNGKVHSFG